MATELDLVRQLRKTPLFRYLSPEDLRLVAELADLHEVKRGTQLCRQSDLGETFFLIGQGEAVVYRVDEHGFERPLGAMYPGDSFGTTSLFVAEPRDATVISRTPMQVWSIDRDGFWDLLEDFPHLLDDLVIPADVWKKAQGPTYAWQEPGEVIVYHCQRHWFVLIKSMLKTSLLLILWFILSSYLSAFLGIRAIALWGNLAASVIYLLILAWRWYDWQNDHFVVSSQRISYRERKAFIREVRKEMPLDRVQNINVIYDFLGRRLHYGHLSVETAAQMGRIFFDHIPYPERLRDAIWGASEQALATRQAAERHLIRQTLAAHLGLDGEEVPELRKGPVEETPIGALPAEVAGPEEQERISTLRRALSILHGMVMLPAVRMETPSSVTWRKHRVFLLLNAFVPALGFVALACLTVAAFLHWPAVLTAYLSFYPALMLILTVFSFGWFWWAVTDWSNDLYRVTDERIIDIERRPLFLSSEWREASLGMIQNVQLRVPNLIASLLNYGNVIVQTAGAGDFTFDRVANPHEVQREIFRRMENYRRAQREREAQRQRRDLAEWFNVYQELRSSANGQPKGEPEEEEPDSPPEVRPETRSYPPSGQAPWDDDSSRHSV